MMDTNIEDYCEFYQELYRMVNDSEAMQEIYERYRGLTITFPKKLYSKEYVHKYLAENYGKVKIQVMARHLELSERRVRQLISEIKREWNEENFNCK